MLNISIIINIILIILLIRGELIFKRLTRKIKWYKTELIKRTEYFNVQQSLIKNLENKLYKLDLELQNKKGVIKFLSDQNIVLNNELENIESNYITNSEAIKSYKLKKGNEKFIQVLQTSK